MKRPKQRLLSVKRMLPINRENPRFPSPTHRDLRIVHLPRRPLPQVKQKRRRRPLPREKPTVLASLNARKMRSGICTRALRERHPPASKSPSSPTSSTSKRTKSISGSGTRRRRWTKTLSWPKKRVSQIRGGSPG